MALVSRENILSIINSYNQWWQTGVVPKGFLRDFKRCAYYVCRKALKSDLRRIVVMSGARRTGKTTVIYQTIADLLNEGVKPRNILFFTFDHPVIRAAGIDAVLSVYKEYISSDDEFYLFADEIQFDDEWTHYLKMAYDMNPEMRAVATGSASAAVEDGVRESGAGRWTVIRVPTLSFYEYCCIKGLEMNADCEDVFKLHTLPKHEQTRIIMGLSDLQSHLMRYLQLGGFPELVNTEDIAYAQALIREDIMDRAIKHDLPKVHDIRSIDELEKVFVYLCYNSSSIINIEAMCKEFEDVSKPTLEKYIRYLADANLINISCQLNIQGKKVLKRKNKIYVSDSGIRCAVVLDADIYTKPDELGYALETTVFKHVSDYFTSINRLYEVGYIRDGNGAEIDVAVQYAGRPIQYIEAKMRSNSTVKDDNGIVVYGMEDVPGYVITKNAVDFGLSERKGTQLYRIPAFAFLYLIGKTQEKSAIGG
ncbi:MAG: ATP-binding protein [Ruminococcaceae bacterium]|nr:ATP-binding protein [Oscillospiraceae bacterium]